MALGADRTFDNGPTDSPAVHIASAVSRWVIAIDAGGMDDQDAATITNPTAQITDSSRHILRREGRRGTFITARLVYDKGLSSITAPKVKLFGRPSPDDAWELLTSKAGGLNATITPDTANNAGNGVMNFTTPDQSAHVWDCLGCNEFLFGVETALAATGDVTTARLEAKIY